MFHHVKQAQDFLVDNPGLSPAELAAKKVGLLARDSSFPRLKDGYRRQSRKRAWRLVFASLLDDKIRPVSDDFRVADGFIRRNTQVDPVCHACEHVMRGGGCKLDN